MNTLQDTPCQSDPYRSVRKAQQRKVFLINALTGQEAALVSEVAGTTTDPVYKPMEIHGLGPCVFIDTAGLDDEGDLGALRIRQTLKAMERTDIALLVCRDEQIGPEMEWAGQLKEKEYPDHLGAESG